MAQLVEHSAPMDGLTRMELLVEFGASRVDIRLLAPGDGLFLARLDAAAHRPAEVSLDREHGRLAIRRPRTTSVLPFGLWLRQGRLELAVNPAVAWSMRLQGGKVAGQLRLDGLPLVSLDVTGGASRLRIALPPPSGHVPISISGGASRIALTLPPSAQARVQVRGGMSRLRAGGESRRSLDELAWQTPAWAQAGDRFEVLVEGGASTVSVATA